MVHPFRRIVDELRDEILEGRLAPGDKLPSENDLAGRYGTTRTTVRKAIAVLRSEGYVASSQGSGSYVRSRPTITMVSTGSQWRARRAGGVANLNAEMDSQGFRAEQKILSVEVIDATADVATALGLTVGHAVVVRRREVTIDGEPTQLSNGYYPAEIFAGTPVASPSPIKGGVMGYFEDELDGHIERFVERLNIRMPTPLEAAALRIPPGVPVARTVRVAYSITGRAIEMLDTVAAGDIVTFEYEIYVPPPHTDDLNG